MRATLWHAVLTALGLILAAFVTVFAGLHGLTGPVPALTIPLSLLPEGPLVALALLGGSAWALWALGRAADDEARAV